MERKVRLCPARIDSTGSGRVGESSTGFFLSRFKGDKKLFLLRGDFFFF